jgi:hypothetical protein
MMNAATVAAKRPAYQKSFVSMAQGRSLRRTHEEEDAIHVALPAFCEGPVILLTLLENDAPELCGRIDILDICVSHFRTWLRKDLTLGYLEHCPNFQAGPLGMDLGFDNKQADGGCPSLHQPGTSFPSS